MIHFVWGTAMCTGFSFISEGPQMHCENQWAKNDCKVLLNTFIHVFNRYYIQGTRLDAM